MEQTAGTITRGNASGSLTAEAQPAASVTSDQLQDGDFSRATRNVFIRLTAEQEANINKPGLMSTGILANT